MSKWYGVVGFADNVEVEPGFYEDTIIEKPYYGDVTSSRWKRQSSGDINDNIAISNQISIVADPYAVKHCSKMVYATYMDTKWKITDVEPQYPRLILSIGGVWNGNTSTVTE